jgi:SHS2 domain-containing protein
LTRGHRFHEHTADITIECWASSRLAAFAEAALATLNVMVNTSTVEPLNKTEVSVTGSDLKELLVEWVGRIIALVDIESSFYSKFEVESIAQENDRYTLKGYAWGEPIDLEKHDALTEVKAMTYADLRIDVEEGRTSIWFTVDL